MLQRIPELKALFYKLLLAYIFFTFSRTLFIYYNLDIIPVNSLKEFFWLCYLGIRFDTTSILYLVSPFILMTIIPGVFTTNINYQKVSRAFYFIGGGLGLAFNFIDIAYYRFNLMRMNAYFLESLENETNIKTLFFHFFYEYFYLIAIYSILIAVWIYFYNKVRNPIVIIKSKRNYIFESFFLFFGVIALCVGGVRGGDFKHSTRPIGTIHAMEKVTNPQHADIVLNTPFSILRTLGKTTIQAQNKFNYKDVKEVTLPVKHYPKNKIDSIKPNVVVFILESFGREYWGALNENREIPDFESFTPFLDSLGKHSLRFPNFFANSRKSIHGMPAVLAGIPSFETAYTSSPYNMQPVESIVSLANNMGYDTSFFHGAPNGSMGMLGFSSLLGFDNYYGKNEYNKNEDFDGYWGIWDEPFMGFMKKTLDEKKSPFFSTIFTITSHEPYIIPNKYNGKFKKGFVPMHQCVGYTDFALKKFFENAKKAPWFDNTIFVFTADHGNQTHFPFYEKTINRFANPLMIFWPKAELKGINNQLGQHMDIYPTLADLMGYDKPFRSWGQSLVSAKVQEPYVINFFGSGSYFIMDDNYICVSNGEKAMGYYLSEDKGLENNLIKNITPEMELLNIRLNMFVQDYMNRIVNEGLK
jgi:phosphoglycerol transferase MdoB-like AlkP superfamily enzyme|tara:strand:- start:377 stop:2299 length:1923 start_codon:yes stop_codon:yes gene_type:complete